LVVLLPVSSLFGVTFLYPSSHDDMYGTIAAGSVRLPAIKTHIKFMCVSPVDGARQENADFWVILAVDHLTNSYRCVKFAGEDVVNESAGQCDFRR
jgi:hypothetical protein